MGRGWVGESVGEWMDGWLSVWVCGCMDEWMDGWMKGIEKTKKKKVT